jgi:ATP/maltotriose-dependent transcriptional regulator MalT/DNA-binding SARP family transcriptional activator
VRRSLGEALDAGHVLVVAPAGYGKTMALEEALGDRRRAVWISCARAAGDSGRLLALTLDGLGDAVSGLAGVVGSGLTGRLEPVEVESAARGLVAELERLLAEPLVVVFDDAETVAAAPAAVRLIDELLRARDLPLSVAVASRTPLPLRVAKLRVEGRLQEIAVADLVLSADECEDLLRLRHGRDLPDGRVEAVMDQTAGWPLGVALAGLAADAPGDAPVPRETLFPFLAEEVVDRLEPSLSEGLVDASVPPELTPQLVEALGLPPGFMDAVERVGLFTARQSDEPDSRAFHPLLRDFLLSRLVSERPVERQRELHATTAQWLARRGRHAEGIDHLLEAGDWGAALAALASVGQELLRTAPATVRDVLGRLPTEAAAEPDYLILTGQLEWGAGNHEASLPHLRAAIAAFAERGDQANAWLARLVLADSLLSVGRFEEALELGDGWEEHPGASAVGVAWYVVVVLMLLGRSDEGLALDDRLCADPRSIPFRYLEQMALLSYDLPAGRSQPAFARLRSTIDALELDSSPRGPLPTLLAAAALAELDVGAIDAAMELFDRCEHESDRLGVGFIARDMYLQRAALLARRGDVAAAELELARAGERRGTGWRGVSRHKAEALVATARGDAQQALAAGERALTRAAPGPLLYRTWTAIDMAPVLTAGGAPETGRRALVDALNELDELFPGARGQYHRARLRAALAASEFTSGQRAAAYDDLRSAWEAAGDGNVDLVRAQWPTLRPLVWQALADGVLEPATVLDAIAEARLGGDVLAAFVDHPRAAVRREALASALASGHPGVLGRLSELTGDSDRQVAAAASAAAERVREDPPPLRFELLGRFRVRRGGWELPSDAWERPMASRLVRYLVARGTVVTEDELFEAFWADRPADTARRHLAVAVSRARKVLDLPGAGSSAIEVSERTYQLRLRDRDTVDAVEFEQAATAALRKDGADRREALEHAAAVWGGEPLPEDRYAPWSFAWRERLLERYVSVLSALVTLQLAAGDDSEALRWGTRLLDVDELNEQAHRTLMVAYARAGRTKQALRQYLECRRALVRGLGVEPSEQTVRLHACILAGEAV